MDILAAPFWVETEADYTSTYLLADFRDLFKVRVHFPAGLVQCFHCRARKFELATWLQRH